MLAANGALHDTIAAIETRLLSANTKNKALVARNVLVASADSERCKIATGIRVRLKNIRDQEISCEQEQAVRMKTFRDEQLSCELELGLIDEMGINGNSVQKLVADPDIYKDIVDDKKEWGGEEKIEDSNTLRCTPATIQSRNDLRGGIEGEGSADSRNSHRKRKFDETKMESYSHTAATLLNEVIIWLINCLDLSFHTLIEFLQIRIFLYI
jgi:hypothetical protein